MRKLNVGIIGTGTIACAHLDSYSRNPSAEVTMICDTNEELAKSRAAQYNIARFCTDVDILLADPSIDAVSICTPTFTHKDLVLKALKAGKHVLCEKPPALRPEDVDQCDQAAKDAGKLLMYGFVCRFKDEVQFLKEQIDAGVLGDIYYAEAMRVVRCFRIGGWFVDKEKSGGGQLIDGAIHELDEVLYLMNYPKIKSVSGFTTQQCGDLPDQIRGVAQGWNSSDKKRYDRTVESMAAALVKFENGACLHIKASFVLNTVNPTRKVELCGTKGGAEDSAAGVRMVKLTDNNFYEESNIVLTAKPSIFDREINHFVDCAQNGTPCIIQPWQGKEVIKLITAIYESAETGKEVLF